ncbi:hypothetical protein O3M35_005968 [Rhynocoris fuscipes]|uniref:Major facilitator superfamily (MFS) profile domain-containing protein n=1 Tax=Rhynocoris fuscipes TaxID=488301 RepID=A0AAW1DD86_9HEMI
MQLSISAILKQVMLAMSASIGYLTIGLVRGFSSPAIPSLKQNNPELVPSEDAVSWISAIPPLGALFGSLVCGPLMQNFGPRRTLLISTPVFVAAWIYIAFSPTWQNLVAARFFTGFAVGIVLPSAQLYVSDCSLPQIRGMVGSLPALFMAAGILVAYIFGSFLKWQTLALSCAAFPAILLCLLCFLPESPVWLQGKGHFDKAEASLIWLHRKPNIDETEMGTVNQQNNGVTEDKEVISNESKDRAEIAAPLWSKQVLVPFSLVVAILVFQQISGIDSIVFYTVTIFQESGSTLGEYAATILVGFVQLIATIISIFLIDYFGRKPLLLTSGLFMSLAMIGLGTYFYLYVRGKASTLGLLPLISQLIFIASYSIGYCSIPFILMGELLPLKYRSLLSSISGAFNLGSMFVVIKTFPDLADVLGSAGAFWIYALCCFISCIFVYFFLPETKGKTLEDIQRYFVLKFPHKKL